MNSVEIHYSALTDAATVARKISMQMTSYATQVNSIINELSNLPGTDDRGYVSSALSLARVKARDSAEQSERYSKFADKLDNFQEYARRQDQTGANGITMTIEAYVGERSFWQKIGDHVYESYVNFLDRLEGLGPVGKLLAKALREGINSARDWIQTTLNWFKYGDGKYILNVIDAIKDVCVAAAILLAAIGAVVTGPWWIAFLGILAVTTSLIYFIQQTIDSSIRVDQNSKGLSLSGKVKFGVIDGDGNITAARYYGEIEGVKDYVEHYDLGNDKINAAAESFGVIYGQGKNKNKAIAKIATLLLTFGAGGLNATDGTKVFKMDRAMESYFFKQLKSGGGDYQTGGYSLGKGLNVFSQLFSGKYTKMVSDVGSCKLILLGGLMIDGAKSLDAIEKSYSAIKGLSSGEFSGYDTIDNVMTVIGNVPVLNAVTEDGWKIISNKKEFADNSMIMHLFGHRPNANAYESFLNTHGGYEKRFEGGGSH